MKIRISTLLISIALVMLALPTVSAVCVCQCSTNSSDSLNASVSGNCGSGGKNLCSGACEFGHVVCMIIFAFKLIAGVAGVVMIAYNGIRIMSSGDDPDTRKAAKKAIWHIIVAIVIIFVGVFFIEAVYTAGIIGASITGNYISCWQV